MKTTFHFLIVLLLIAGLYSCSKDKGPDGNNVYTQTYFAGINGVKAIPTNSSPASGTFRGSFSSSNRTLSYTITYAGTNPTSGDVRQGTLTTEGSSQFALNNLTASPYTGSVVLSAAQENDLNAGLFWVKIASLGFPNGEIRGQIVKQ